MQIRNYDITHCWYSIAASGATPLSCLVFYYIMILVEIVITLATKNGHVVDTVDFDNLYLNFIYLKNDILYLLNALFNHLC
jgi:hypothetical protein